MKKNLMLWALIAAFVLVLGGAYVLYGRLSVQYQPEQLATQAPEETQDATEEAKIYAPDFTAVDADGNEVSLSDFLGKPVVLNFWASWCGPCKSEMPEFDEAYLQQGEEIQFLMVNMTDGAQETADTRWHLLPVPATASRCSTTSTMMPPSPMVFPACRRPISLMRRAFWLRKRWVPSMRRRCSEEYP